MKKENVTDSSEIRAAYFKKLFGEDPEMHIPAGKTELKKFCRKQSDNELLVYAVGVQHPVPARTFLPRCLNSCQTDHFRVRCGSFFVFQIAVFALKENTVSLEPESGRWSVFTPSKALEAGEMNVFYLGRVFKTEPGTENETFRVRCSDGKIRPINITFERFGPPVSDFGDHEPEGLSRLRWMNSDIGCEDTVYSPYIPLKVKRRKISFLGHSLYLGSNGLPENADSRFSRNNIRCTGKAFVLLEKPLFFGSGRTNFTGEMQFDLISRSHVSWHCSGKIGRTPAELKGHIWFDGFVSISIELKTGKDIQLRICPVCRDYFAGLGFHGGKTPDPFNWHFDPNHYQDSFWIGNINGGMRLRLRSPEHRTPLTNCYYHFDPLTPPEAWDNGGKGSVSFDGAEFLVRTGKRKASGNLVLAFDLQFTPFHPVEQEKQICSRTWHPLMHQFKIGDADPVESAELKSLADRGITRINIHHAVGMNPFINYPYTSRSLARLKRFVEKAHKFRIEVGLYYTMRELSIHIPEFYAMLWCGDIFFPGPMEKTRSATNPNGPHPWLCEHLDIPYLPAWAEVIKNGEAAGNTDISLITVPESRRLENFFLEGLRFLLEQCPIDGLYLDDASISREGFHRLHRIFRKYRKKAPFIDFHAWNPYSLSDKAADFGKTSVIVRDMHMLPHVTELWLGEGFDYENSSYEYYLTEISGIPFGIPSEMLFRGGNPWRGILFGMTSRFGWYGDPRNLWKFFDDFGVDGLVFDITAPPPFDLPEGIRSSRITNTQGKKGYILGSWSLVKAVIDLHNMTVPEIPGFQKPAKKKYVIEPNHGVILICGRKGEKT